MGSLSGETQFVWISNCNDVVRRFLLNHGNVRFKLIMKQWWLLGIESDEAIARNGCEKKDLKISKSRSSFHDSMCFSWWVSMNPNLLFIAERWRTIERYVRWEWWIGIFCKNGRWEWWIGIFGKNGRWECLALNGNGRCQVSLTIFKVWWHNFFEQYVALCRPITSSKA